MKTPTTIDQLKFKSHVIVVEKGDSPNTAAVRFFRELFDPKLPVYTRFLFSEREGDDCEGDPVYLGSSVTRVYEAYQDSASDDYLYLLENIDA